MSDEIENDDNNWKWGLFYYNPNDPKLMVPKRFGIGWTFNFGHTMAYVIMGLILAFIIGDILYATGVVKF